MGDKTQLLTLLLVSRFHKPFTILLGILFATLLNHALASWAGLWAASFFSPLTLKWILAGTFFFFAAWVLIPDKASENKSRGHFGAFFTTLVAFFLAEMGDKTQLATVALGARYASPTLVTIGTTLGMMASNSLAILLGKKLLAKVPMQWIHAIASLLFLLFGILILVGY